jgi:hypothetical protein
MSALFLLKLLVGSPLIVSLLTALLFLYLRVTIVNPSPLAYPWIVFTTGFGSSLSNKNDYRNKFAGHRVLHIYGTNSMYKSTCNIISTFNYLATKKHKTRKVQKKIQVVLTMWIRWQKKLLIGSLCVIFLPLNYFHIFQMYLFTIIIEQTTVTVISSINCDSIAHEKSWGGCWHRSATLDRDIFC